MLQPDMSAKTAFISSLPDLLKALVSAVWVVFAAFAFWKFYSPLKAAIDSRALSFEVGGFKLSFQEAAEGLKKQISDLQSRVVLLEKPNVAIGKPSSALVNEPDDFEAAQPNAGAAGEYSPGIYDPRTLRLHVLWVEGNPKGIAYQIAAIQSEGGTVDITNSTSEGLEKFEPGRYDAVITNLGRQEGGTYREGAGIDLIKAIRERDKRVCGAV